MQAIVTMIEEYRITITTLVACEHLYVGMSKAAYLSRVPLDVKAGEHLR